MKRKMTIKPASPNDNLGEIMVSMMPLQANLKGQPRIERYEEAECPYCKEPCFFDRQLIRQANVIYGGRMIMLCSHCALEAHCDNNFVPHWLKSTGKTVKDVLESVLGGIAGD